MELKERQYLEKQGILTDIEEILGIMLRRPEIADNLEKRVIHLYEEYQNLPGENPPMFTDIKHSNNGERQQMQDLFKRILENNAPNNI
jgi:DNA-binding TFAR19-related protein (PDSD5 family)